MSYALRIAWKDFDNEVNVGYVAAWRQIHHEGREYSQLAGYADPIMAAVLIEEAEEHNTYVWVVPAYRLTERSPSPSPTDLALIRGRSIIEGRVFGYGTNSIDTGTAHDEAANTKVAFQQAYDNTKDGTSWQAEPTAEKSPPPTPTETPAPTPSTSADIENTV